jgi:hypothetical protein
MVEDEHIKQFHYMECKPIVEDEKNYKNISSYNM